MESSAGDNEGDVPRKTQPAERVLRNAMERSSENVGHTAHTVDLMLTELEGNRSRLWSLCCGRVGAAERRAFARIAASSTLRLAVRAERS